MNERSNRPSRGDLLDAYAHREIESVVQFDGFCHMSPGDPVMPADKHGDCYLSGGDTWDFRPAYSGDVRVTILSRTTKKDALRLLKEITAWVKSGTDPVGQCKHDDGDNRPF